MLDFSAKLDVSMWILLMVSCTVSILLLMFLTSPLVANVLSLSDEMKSPSILPSLSLMATISPLTLTISSLSLVIASSSYVLFILSMTVRLDFLMSSVISSFERYECSFIHRSRAFDEIYPTSFLNELKFFGSSLLFR